MNNFTKIVAIGLVLLAAVLGFFAYKMSTAPKPEPVVVVQQVERPVVASKPTRAVILAAKDILAGQVIQADMLKEDQWPSVPGNGFANTEDLVGKVVRFDIAAEEPITKGLLAMGIASYLADGQRAITIPVDEIVGAGNLVAPGDIVDVFFTLNSKGDVGAQSRLLLPQVRVLAYGDNTVDGPATPPANDERQQRTRATPARIAMLAVSLEDVNKLLLATRNGKLQLALRAPHDENLPDMTLFPEPEPVLKGKPDLTPEQLAALENAGNMAYAGMSLPDLSGELQEDDDTPDAPVVKQGNSGKTVQIIRGTQIENVKY
ncbi:Flp pilus assembly protein CpaB [Advenella faeciporci]|uniref:Flp pilus assembly protein CpaB n=1 Tax=Advenella faeciporci TaxID=797535 RepID=A0A918JQ33_9BURK|nr:Flp pilus assembly protein CpaB [Advenella faeciporci]GGW89281.1 Flp pilus assembly protein CpaB [Advenella faeciporci]